MPIPEDFVELVRSQADIVEIISEFVPLRRRGRSYLALCPFHKEKTPSFSVSPERGIFKCFGCGKGGNVFTFLMEYLGISFPEAVRMVADRLGIAVPESAQETDAPLKSEKEQIYRALRAAANFFRNMLASPEGKIAREYLKQRGIESDVASLFELGYAPAGWDKMQRALEKEGFSIETLLKAGLLAESESSRYDRFRNRLIFPIFHTMGQVIGFGARQLHPDEPPKYLNSPQTPVYDKSQALYGLYQAREAIREAKSAVVVEGYMDVLTLFQAGIRNVVATCGTALTADHLRLLKRYAAEVRILYDQDTAGQQAAMRAVEQACAAGVDAFVVQLPAGEDPDSFVRKFSAPALRQRIAQAQPGFAFLIHQLHHRGNLDTPSKQAEAVKYLVGVIAQMPEPLQQDFAIRSLAQQLHIPETRLYAVLEQMQRKQTRTVMSARRASSSPPSAPASPSSPAPSTLFPEEKAIFQILLHHPESVRSAIENGLLHAELFLSSTAQELLQTLRRFAQSDTGEWIHTVLHHPEVSETVKTILTELAIDPIAPSEKWKHYDVHIEVDEQQIFRDSLRRLQLRKLEQERLQIQQQLQGVEAEAMRALLEKLQHIQQQIAALQAEIHT